jgi:hypothetical protein
MKLKDAFEQYDDSVRMKRKSAVMNFDYDIGWLKQMAAWGNQELDNMGFMIPRAMIEDAQADDWEVIGKD